MITILKGIGGSINHGLDTPESDIDIRGVFAHPTETVLGMQEPQQSVVTTDPDSTMHELRKFLTLCSKGNPDVLETLACRTYLEKEPEWGDRLIELTPSLLNAPAIRAAFVGYAQGQFKLLEQRGDFGAGMERRTWKHAKHMLRLTQTAYWILRTGALDYSVCDRHFMLNVIPTLSKEELVRQFFAMVDEVDHAPTDLPDAANMVAVNQFLIDYRKAH